MDDNMLIELRSKLGMYIFKKGGYCQLGQNVDGSFYISVHETGKPLRTRKSEPEYIIAQAKYFADVPHEIKEFRPKYPELAQFFTKSGLPKTNANVLLVALEEMPKKKQKSTLGGLENLFKNFN